MRRLLGLFRTHELPVTWAFVGRLLDDSRGFDGLRGDRGCWYAPDLVEAIRDDPVDHEIATHSYGHVYFGESSAEAVRADLMRARAVHEAHGLPFRSLVFPRNQVAHLDIVAEAGIEVFRSVDAGVLQAVSRRAPQLRPLVNLADKALPIAPPVVHPVRRDHGLIELPSSLLLIGRNGLRRVVSPAALRSKLRAGLTRAVETGALFHLWFHPSNFYTGLESQLDVLDDALGRAAELAARAGWTSSPWAPSVPRRYPPPDRLVPTDLPPSSPGPADRPALARLAAGLWGPDGSDLFSGRWWWNDDEPHCWIAEHLPSGDVAAVCAQRRPSFLIAGRSLPASTVSDWYVSPVHAGAGLGKALVQKGAETSAYMYTTAISESAAVGFSRLGWTGDRRLPMSVGLVPLARSLAGRPAEGLEIERRWVSDADPGDLSPIDEIWEQLRWPDAAMMVRDADHIRRHLALAGGRRYSLLIARRRQRPVGYLLHRILPGHTLRALGPARVGIVTDYLVDQADVSTLASLIGEACRQWWAQRVLILMALSATPGHQAVFSRLGLLRPITIGGRLLGGRLSNRTMHQPGPGSEGSWHVTFADNDTDLILGSTGRGE